MNLTSAAHPGKHVLWYKANRHVPVCGKADHLDAGFLGHSSRPPTALDFPCRQLCIHQNSSKPKCQLIQSPRRYSYRSSGLSLCHKVIHPTEVEHALVGLDGSYEPFKHLARSASLPTCDWKNRSNEDSTK